MSIDYTKADPNKGTYGYGVPYPLGDDSLSNLAARIQQLAEYIDISYGTLGINLSSSAVLMQEGDAAGGDLAGSTYPNPIIKNDAITTAKILNRQVTGNKIDEETVDTINLVDSSVTTAKLDVVALKNGSTAVTQAQSDGSTKIATTAYVDAYIAGTIPSGSIDTSELADGAVTNAKVDAAAGIEYSKLDLTGEIIEADLSFDVATQLELDAHVNATTSVHGISDTNDLVYTTDSRLSDDRNPTAHGSTHELGGSDEIEIDKTQVTGTAIVEGDARLSDARTPTTHATTHESGGSDELELAPGQITGTAVITSDSRLSDARTPTAHASTHESGGSDEIEIAPSQVTGTAVVTSDSRLTDARTPTAHASTHVPGGADAIDVSKFIAQGSALPLLPDALYPAGTLFAVGSAPPYLIYRSSGAAWDQLGASAITVSDTAPATPQAGDLWYESDTGKTFIYYDSFWVEMGNNTNASVPLHGVEHEFGGADELTIDSRQLDYDFIGYPAYRNVIINGAMQVAQRATSSTSLTAGGYYTSDRWNLGLAGLGTWTQSIENDAPTGSGFRKSLKMLCTTADAAPAAADTLSVRQFIEGQSTQHFAKGTSSAKKFAVSFWVKSNVTGTYICELYDNDNTRQVSASYTISASATWEKKTIVFPADTTGAFDNDSESSLWLNFWLGAGSDRTSGTLNTSWDTATQSNRVVGQTNLAAATNNYWQITGVQLEPEVVTPFEFEPYETTLAKCQRYFFVLNGAGMAPGATRNTTSAYCPINFPVEMRSSPTATLLTAASTFIVKPADATETVTSISTFGGTTRSTRLQANVASGLVAGDAVFLQASTGGGITFGAEL